MHEWSLILLFAVCLAVEASNVISCGTVLNYSAPVIDIAAYDVDGSAQVNIEGCVWESANITLSFRRSIAVTVERVTLTRCSLVLAGTASASIPPGSKVSFVSVSASQCGDCCSVVTAEALSDFSLHVVDSVLSASRSAASIMSPAAVRCSISIIRSTIDVRSTTRAATSSGCFWSATSSMLNLSAVQLMVLSSKITTATTGQYSCCVGALSPNALEVRNADFRVSGSFLDATGGTSTLTNGAVVSVGFISVTKGALLESCTLTVHSSKITAALTGAAGGAVASVGAATSANYPLRVSSTSFLASFSTLSAAMTVPENENFFSAAALGFAAGRNSIEATAVRIQATASRISSEIGSNCETGTAAASMALVSRALLIAIDDCIITAIGCTVSAVGSAGDDAAAAAIGVASTGTASHLPVFSGNSMFAVNTTVIVSLQGVGCAAAVALGFAFPCAEINVFSTTLYSFNSSLTATTRANQKGVAVAAGLASTQPLHATYFLAVILSTKLYSSVSTVGNNPDFMAASAAGFTSDRRIDALHTSFYASGSTFVVSAASDLKSYAAAMGMANHGLLNVTNATISAINCTATSSSYAGGWNGKSASMAFVGGGTSITAVRIYAINSTIRSLAQTDGVNRESVAASLGVNAAGALSSISSISIVACGCFLHSDAKLSSIGACVASVNGNEINFTVLKSLLEADACIRTTLVPPTRAVLCSVDIRCTGDVGWTGDADGNMNNVWKNGSPLDPESSFFPGLTGSFFCPISAATCPFEAPPTVTVPAVDNVPPSLMGTLSFSAKTSASIPLSRSGSSLVTTRSALLNATHSITHTRSISHTQVDILTPSTRTSTASDAALTGGERGSSSTVGSLATLMPQSAARAVVALSVVSSAASSFLLASGVGSATAPRIGFVLATVDCRYNDEDTDPSLLQYPLPVGDGLAAHAVGIASSCVVIGLLVAFGAAVSSYTDIFPKKKALSLLRTAESIFHQYYSPNICSGAVLVGRHSNEAGPIVVSVLGASLELSVILHRCYVVVWRLPQEVRCERGPDVPRGTIKSRWVGVLAEQYGAFFEMCRNALFSVRMCFFVELGVSWVMGIIAGWRPSSGSCTTLAAVMFAFSILLCLYELVCWPYQCWRDNVFSCSFACLQIVQSSVAVCIATGWMNSTKPLAVITLCQSCGLIVQLGIAIAWESVLQARRLHSAPPSGASSSLDNCGTLDVPLTATLASNPLSSQAVSHFPV